MGTNADKLEYLLETKNQIKQAIIDKGVNVTDTDTFRSYATKIGEIQSGSPSTQAQSIFTGATAPLTYLNCTENQFVYESATHNITISGLDNIATISGNGTNQVTVTFNVSGTSNTQTPFIITCVKDTETLTYNGLAFHYGSEVADGNCLAVAQTLTGTPLDIGYVFIESASLPLFSSNTTLWNNIYSYQILTFSFGKWNNTSIGKSFLRSCSPFNQPLTIPSSVTSIGHFFLSDCSSFNQPLTIPSGVTRIGDNFLSASSSFNQPLTIPSGVTSIGDNFLSASSSFNQPLTIPSGVTRINTYFLYNCNSFNQPLTIPSGVTRINTYFLSGCISFNQPLTIPSSVTSIGGYFLYNCNSFNQPLTIPSSVTSINTYFLSGCISFNQPLTIPSSVTSISNNFLRNCVSFIKLEYNASVYPTDDYSLSQNNNNKTSTNGTGILITGTNASELKASLPDRTSSPYRKLVLQE